MWRMGHKDHISWRGNSVRLSLWSQIIAQKSTFLGQLPVDFHVGHHARLPFI